jgi:hypothetical protein
MSSRRFRAAALVGGLSWGLSGCATPAAGTPSAAPAASEPPTAPAPAAPLAEAPGSRSNPDGVWSELRSEHFVFRTDASLDAGQARLEKMERLRQALLAAAWNGAKAEPDVLTVVDFDQRLEMDELFDNGDKGVGWLHIVHAGQETLVLGGDNLREERDAAEALALHLSRFFLPRTPHWFRVGLGVFLSTAKVSEDETGVDIGLPPSDPTRPTTPYGPGEGIRPDSRAGREHLGSLAYGYLGDLTKYGRMPVAKLLTYGVRDYDLGSEQRQFFATSWLLVTVLFNQHPQQFRDLQVRYAKGEAPQAAWDAVMAGVTPAQLDKELTDFMVDGQLHLRHAALAWVKPRVTPRLMPQAEVEAQRALLFLHAPGKRSRERKEALASEALARALTLDPTNVSALELLYPLRGPEATLPGAQAAAAKHPEDARAWLLLGECLPRDAKDRDAAFSQAAKLAPDSPRIQSRLARRLVSEGQFDPALDPAVRAMKLLPVEADPCDVLGQALAGVGRACQAVTLEARALSLLQPEEEGNRAAYEAHFQKAQAACDANLPPPLPASH